MLMDWGLSIREICCNVRKCYELYIYKNNRERGNMAIKYNLTPIEAVKLFGYTEPEAKEELELFEKENHIKLPKLLFNFLSLVRNKELLSTADIWVDSDSLPYFSYQYIEEGIEDCKGDYDDPEFREQNAFYPYFKIPKEQWPEFVDNYLQVGSDYAAGVVFYGIKEKELTQENPPVYMLHEADPLEDWKLIAPTLSEYLMCILLDALAGVEYRTAQEVLNENGWEFYEEEYKDEKEVKEQLAKKKIDLSTMKKNISFYGVDSFYRYCFDEEEKIFYMVIDNTSIIYIKAE